MLVDLQASPDGTSNLGYLLTPVSETSTSPKKRKGKPQRSISKQDPAPGIVFKLGIDQIYPDQKTQVNYVNYSRLEHLEFREKYKRMGKLVKVGKKQVLGNLDSVASSIESPGPGSGRKKRLRTLASATVAEPTLVKRRKNKQVLPVSPPQESDSPSVGREDDLLQEDHIPCLNIES